MTREETITEIIKENERRNAEISAKFDPITGQNSIGKRRKVLITDYPIMNQWLPVEMLRVPLIRQIYNAGSIRRFLEEEMCVPYTDEDKLKVIWQFVKIRCRYDFPFWAATFVYIKNKDGGANVLFRLTRPQRKFVARLEELRKANKPIRIVLLKARQWGGSTTSQLYMAWLQLVHKVGLNSLIIAHQGTASDEIEDMFRTMISSYPVEMLHKLGEAYSLNEPKFVGVGRSGNIHRVPQRNCKIKIGTAERPDGCRGGDYSLVHLSEVGLWKATEGKVPEDIVQSACSGVALKPYTMIVYESTAKGVGNFFHREYRAAKAGTSQFEAMFVSWYDIERYSLDIDDIGHFAEALYDNRNNANVDSSRQEPGKYLWWLWEKGATLEAINWYIQERAKYDDHGRMASEYPSDDIEAFVHSGTMVFDRYQVNAFYKYCKAPKFVGDVYADGDKGKRALKNLRFSEDHQGLLWVWNMPETDPEEKVLNRYLVVVDVGGRSAKADWSVIVVFDRLFMMDGGKPVVVAQWYGHCDMDILAWKAAQIAAFYDDALLVIESNTLETHDKERDVDGDQSGYILNEIKGVYSNLYARKQSPEDILEGLPVKYGFHTNVATKPVIISTLIKVVREGLYVERDERCLNEMLVYEKKQNNSYGAVIGEHDDLLMTRAIGMQICLYEMDLPKIIVRTRKSARGGRKKAVSAATI